VDDTLLAAEIAARSFDGRPQVRAADHVTRYTRTGAGKPVLVLDEPTIVGTLWPELLSRLAEHHRVILPEVPDAELHFYRWLRGFAEGMGLPVMTMIAVGNLCVPALEFALLEPDRVDRLVLVSSGSADETALAGTLTPALSSAHVAMLVVRRDTAPANAIAAIEGFMRDETS
jgi:pimeloyl-ACP methyl ester carboxylesterase